MIYKKDIEKFILSKRGYLKKSPLVTAKAIWKVSPKKLLPKTHAQIEKELSLIKEVQTNLRLAKDIVYTEKQKDLHDAYHSLMQELDRPKRKLFFDIETTPNIVYSWRIGRDISLTHDNIIKERAVICICYKWSDENETKSLSWSKGNDKEMLKTFAKIINSADEIVGQNSDRFDVKWLRARCLYHRIPLSVKFNSIDTLKMAKAGFYFNSNKLDYMGQFLGVGKKIHTDYELWKEVMDGDREALSKMIEYCIEDVELLERVYNEIQPYCPEKKFRYKTLN